MLIFIGNAILWFTTIPAILFVAFYSRVRWERTSIGRQTMALSLSMMLILINATLATMFPHYAGRPVVRLVIFSTICPVLWWRLTNLINTQREVIKRRGKHD